MLMVTTLSYDTTLPINRMCSYGSVCSVIVRVVYPVYEGGISGDWMNDDDD